MKPTFGQVFAFSLVGLIAILAVLFQLVSQSSKETIGASSERIREQASRAIGERIAMFLDEAPETVRQFQREVGHGLVDPHDGPTLEPALLALLLAHSEIGEVTFTYAQDLGFADDGTPKLAPEARGQWSAVRNMGPDGKPHLWSRHVHQDAAGNFVADRREISMGGLADQLWSREGTANFPDPTAHPTFTTPASKNFRGQLLWSDLHWSQLDADLPVAQRRVEVSVQQAITEAGGERLFGVLRVGLLVRQIDEEVRQPLMPSDPHRIFICDPQGRLITRMTDVDQLEEVDDDLRISPRKLSPDIAGALASPALREAVEKGTTVSGEFRAAGRDYLVTFRPLPPPQTQEWVIGIVVSRDYYFGRLIVMRERLLEILLAVMGLIVAAGALILWGVRREQAQITRESLKMNAFDFSPAKTDSLFRDVAEVLESQEKAKTAMRAMSKYVPVDLVRRLYRAKSEPELGGELIEVSIMFTDIRNFTSLSEKMAPNDLADALGQYLGTMAGIIQRDARGTIDKFIGDGIMTFWNAPEPAADHARLACQAALGCRDAGRALAQSPDWNGRPAFETRFGLHCAPALIGHFGAPERMNYTAMGDAVNVASRLEGLNKEYGTTIIASEAIVQRVSDDFVFRLLDLVAVKGRSEAIRIYELLGRKGEVRAVLDTVAAYEMAFAAYCARDFAAAIKILEPHFIDAPSARLLKRAREFRENPPEGDWCGVSVSLVK